MRFFSLPRLRLNLRKMPIVAAALMTLGAASTAIASPSTLTSFTWSGATPTTTMGAPNWSNGTNWVGGVAPSGHVGRITLPALTSAACTSSPPTDTCYQGIDNIAGLAAQALSIDDGAAYFVQGTSTDPLKLAAGGLKATTTSTTFQGAPQLQMPLILTAAQTWTIDGNNRNQQLGVVKVTGPTHALTLDLNHQTFLGVGSGNVEVGPLTIATTQTTGFNFSSVALGSGGKLNATDGSSVSLMGAGTGIFASANASVGALTADAGNIQVGNGNSGAAKLSVVGGFTQGSSNALVLNVIKPGTTAGTDYSQVSATGAISLAGTLRLSGSTSGASPTCPTLHVGDVDTLLMTTGALTGTFANYPNGSTATLSCSPGTAPTGRINYTANSMTFTVLTAGAPSTAAPVPGSTSGRPTWYMSGSTTEARAG